MHYLMDTDWAVYYLTGRTKIRSRLKRIKKQVLAISTITLAELYEGVYYSRNPGRSQQMLDKFLKGIRVLGIDEETCKIFGKEPGRIRALRARIGDLDLLDRHHRAET